jgi:hypothetical protein
LLDEVLLYDNLAEQVEALNSSLPSALVTATEGENVSIELDDIQPNVRVDALRAVDAAVKRLTRAQRFTVVQSGRVWLSFTPEQWRRSNVNRESGTSLFAKFARSQPITLKQARAQLMKNGAYETT